MRSSSPTNVKSRFCALTLLAVIASSFVAGAAPPRPSATPTVPATSTDGRFVVPAGDRTFVTKDVTLRDPDRDKDVELRVRVPIATDRSPMPAAGWPLVVFSHGAGGSRNAFPDLLDFWAKSGVASIAMTHSDSLELKRRTTGAAPGTGGRQLMTEEGRAQLRREVDLLDRVNDCKFVLDKLPDISTLLVAAGGRELKVDPARLAVAGHSAGAFTTQLCAGVTARAVGVGQRGLAMVSIADDRFKAAIIISGQGTSSRLLDESSWSNLKIPILVFAGSLDTSPSGMGKETPETRQHPFTKSPGTAKGGQPAYLMYIEGATHSSYAGKGVAAFLREQSTTDIGEIQDAVATATMLFLQAHLIGDDNARATLAKPVLADTIPGKVRWEHK